LREIREEIPLLANHFLKEYCRDNPVRSDGPGGRRTLEFSGAVLRKLVAAPWPGNVRQLRNEVMRLAACATANIIDEDDLLEGMPAADHERPMERPVPVQSLKRAIADLECRMIAEALQQTRKNQLQAAKLLGLSRQGLINKMKRYAIAD
jgi:DNA-binding NtrC family response regulator